jgi:hypothetical protein
MIEPGDGKWGRGNKKTGRPGDGGREFLTSLPAGRFLMSKAKEQIRKT